MYLLVTGEGGTDVGSVVRDAGDAGERFLPGPMAKLIDRMLEPILGYSVLDAAMVLFLGRVELARAAKELGSRPRLVLPGVKRPAGYAGDYRQAYALAKHALNIVEAERCGVISVMFRDSDGTQSASETKWRDQVSAIEAAFVAAGYRCGVAMVAKPKQEAWLLCAAKPSAYVACEIIEEESGNDASPRSLKSQLEAALGCALTVEVLVDFVVSQFDHSRVDMPSFNAFRASLELAARHALMAA